MEVCRQLALVASIQIDAANRTTAPTIPTRR